MKKRTRILCLLVSVLVVFALFPMQAASGTDYGKVFDELTFEGVSKYNKPLPKGGTKQSEAQINRTLASIKYKAPGKGKVVVDHVLAFSSVKGKIVLADKYSYWVKTSGKNESSYSEHVNLLRPTATRCTLVKSTSKEWSHRIWYKDADKGYINTNKNKSSSSKPSKTHNYKTYKDATVLGQKCFVYSYKNKGEPYTHYNYVSRKTGITIKTISIYFKGGTFTRITFAHKKASEVPGNFAAPENVKFFEHYDLRG